MEKADDEEVEEASTSETDEENSECVIDYIWKRTGEPITLDATQTAIESFMEGLKCGSRVKIRHGSFAGTTATIIGVLNGFLWRHDDNERGAGAFKGFNARDIQKNYDLEIIGEIRMSNIRRVISHTGQKREKNPAHIHRISTVLQLLLPKEPLFYFPAVFPSAMEAGRSYDPRRLATYETAPQALEKIGYASKQLVLYRAGPRRGHTAIIVGTLKGRLVRQERGDFPRAFDSCDTIEDSDLAVISCGMPFHSYPRDVFRLNMMEYQTNDLFLMKNWGLLHGLRIQHANGPLRDKIGVVLGVTGGNLVEYIEALGECVTHDSPEEVAIPEKVKIIGAHCGLIQFPASPTTYAFPRSALEQSGTSQSQLCPFDVRYSVCTRELGFHGQAVKITLGPRIGDVGRIVGMYKKDLHAVFDMDEGAIPMRPEEKWVLLSRPPERLFRPPEPPRDAVVMMPTAFGERVFFDMTAENCLVFGFLPMQRVKFRPRERELKTPVENKTEWRMGTVIGVWYYEIWVLDDATGLAIPLEGTNEASIFMNYDIEVCGLCTSLTGSHTDPFLSSGDITFRTRDEFIIQENSSVIQAQVLLPGAREPQLMGLDISTEAFEALCAPPRGARLRAVQRMFPKLHHVKRHGESHDTWQLFTEPLWATVIGVANHHIFVVRDESPDVAVTINEIGGQSEIVDQHDPTYVPPPEFSWKVSDNWEKSAPHQSALQSGSQISFSYPFFPIAPMDFRSVESLAKEISDRRLTEMRLAFSLLPRDRLISIVQWILGLYSLHLKEYDHVDAGLRRLCVVIDKFSQPFYPPTLQQWFLRERQVVEEHEHQLRHATEVEERNERSSVAFHEMTQLFKIKNLESLFARPDAGFVATSDSPATQNAFALRKFHLRRAPVVPSRIFEVSNNQKLPSTFRFRATVAKPMASMIGNAATTTEEEFLSSLPYWPMKYILSSGKVVHFDISRSACAHFGMYHGERYEIGIGDLQGTVVTIVGVLNKRLWRYSEGREVQPFQDLLGQDVVHRHQLKLVGTAASVRKADTFLFHSFYGELLEFDIHDEAFEPFGVKFGDRYLVATAGSGLFPGTQITVVGVRESRVWLAQDWSGAKPFDGKHLKEELKLKFLYTADILSLLGSIEANLRHGNANTVKCLVHPFSKLCLDVTKEACEPFGVFPGQVVQHMSGSLSPQHVIILGVHQGRLYRQQVLDKPAVKYDYPASKFRAVYELKHVKWIRPPGFEVSLDTSSYYSERQRSFCFPSMVGQLYLFDVREEICKSLFGFNHGDKVVFQKKGKYFGKTAVIIGIRKGLLWKIDDGDVVATMFHGCKNRLDLEQEYNPRFVCKTYVKEAVG